MLVSVVDCGLWEDGLKEGLVVRTYRREKLIVIETMLLGEDTVMG